EMLCFRQIGRQPGEQQIENIIIGTVAESEADHFSLLQQVSKRGPRCCANWVFGLRAAASNVVAFDLRKLGVRAGVAIKDKEHREINDAEDSGKGKVLTPAKLQQHPAQQWDSDRRGEFRH